MSLALVGKDASFEFRWLRWALLRDALTSDDGTPYPAPHLASLGDALDGRPRRLPAEQLAREIAAIRERLRVCSIEGLVLGPETAAVLYMGARLTAPRRLGDLELGQIAPIGESSTLDEYFASMFEAIQRVCAHPFEDGAVEILAA